MSRGLVPIVTWARIRRHEPAHAISTPLMGGVLFDRDNLHADRGTLQLAKDTLQLSGGTLHDAGDNRGGHHAGEGGWHDASESGKKLFKISGFFLRRLAGKLYFCKIILKVLQDSCNFFAR